MKKLLILLLSLLLIVPAMAETVLPETESLLPEAADTTDWAMVGYSPAGLTFLVPADTQSFTLTDAEKEAGYRFLGMNADYTIQMEQYTKDVMTLDVFSSMIGIFSGAEGEMITINDVEILIYRNPTPSTETELCGIALMGLDGCMYRFSFFTGTSGDFSDDAPVWAIARAVAESMKLEAVETVVE